MNKKDYVLRTQRIRKWVEARRGRLPLLAELSGRSRNNLYAMIYENKMSPDLVHSIERKQLDIEDLEKACIKKFPTFSRFIMKGEGRAQSVAAKIGVTPRQLRNLAYSKGDGRYLLIKYGVEKVMQAIKDYERTKERTSYSYEKVDIRELLTAKVKKSVHTLDQIIHFAGLVKDHADAGNCDAAVLCRQVKKDQYKVLSIGFDSHFSDMCKGHVCEKDNPHLHASMFAALNMPKQPETATDQIILFSHSAPCPNCAARLISIGVNRTYCYFEPELMGGLMLLAKQNIPVFKINAIDNSHRQINGLATAAA